MSYRDLGLAERLGGHELLEAEATGVGEALPLDGGGLNAKGHAAGPRVWHSASSCSNSREARPWIELDGARIALAHNIGGPTAVSAVTILEGSGTQLMAVKGPERWSTGIALQLLKQLDALCHTGG